MRKREIYVPFSHRIPNLEKEKQSRALPKVLLRKNNNLNPIF